MNLEIRTCVVWISRWNIVIFAWRLESLESTLTVPLINLNVYFVQIRDRRKNSSRHFNPQPNLGTLIQNSWLLLRQDRKIKRGNFFNRKNNVLLWNGYIIIQGRLFTPTPPPQRPLGKKYSSGHTSPTPSPCCTPQNIRQLKYLCWINVNI